MNFTKSSWNLGWKIENDLYWLRLVADTGTFRLRSDHFADLLRIGGIFHKLRIYRFACWVSWSSAMLRQMESWRTSPGVFLVDPPGRGSRISERKNQRLSQANICTCERVQRPQSHSNHARHINTLIDIIKAIICLHCQIVKVRQKGSICPIKIFCIFQLPR